MGRVRSLRDQRGEGEADEKEGDEEVAQVRARIEEFDEEGYGLKVSTEEGLKPISEASSLVQSLKKAEEGRMRVLVLGEEGMRAESSRISELVRRALRS